jgi:ATP phosphoribosyltransferase regulatory subunit HisZ
LKIALWKLKVGAKYEKPNIVEAEARVLELALFDLQKIGWLPVAVQLGCVALSQKLVDPLYRITSKELRNIF